MKKPFHLTFAATSLVLSFAAYSQSPNPLFQHLPPNAGHIYEINFNQINSKGNIGALLGSVPPSKNAQTGLMLSVLKDPAAAGVDLSQNIFFTQTTADGTGSDTLSFINVLVRLSDSAKFRSALTGSITGIHIHRLPGKGVTAFKEHLGVAWNDQLVVITLATAEHGAGKTTHPSTPAPHRPIGEIAVEKSLAALAGFPGSPLLTDQRFQSGFATNEDIHAWSIRMDMMQMMTKLAGKMAAKHPGMQGKPMPDYSNMGQTPRPPVLTTFNFDNGRIVLRTTMFYKPEDAAILHGLYDRPLNKDLLARVPNNGQLLGFVAAHINPSTFPDVLDKYHTRKMVDSMLGKKGLTINDISGVIGGDFLVAVLSDTSAVTDTAKKKINFYFVATLGDPAKLMQIAAKMGAAGGEITDTAGMAKMKKFADKLVIRDNMLVVSTTREMAQQYFSNQDRRSTALAGDDNSPARVAIDLKAVSSFIGQSMASNPKALIFARMLEKLDKIDFSVSIPDGNNLTMTFQIITAEPSTNSLNTLMSILH
ncbi:MAG TPA: hypothetical protein VG052_02675 [Puia sp.]|jgi:hypothetical protein|nr:hypothetical protein [Puia sp.]